jgi:hypothetical protein
MRKETKRRIVAMVNEANHQRQNNGQTPPLERSVAIKPQAPTPSEKPESLNLRIAKRELEPHVAGRQAEADGMRQVLEDIADNKISLAAYLLAASGEGLVQVAKIREELFRLAGGDEDIEQEVTAMSDQMMQSIGRIPVRLVDGAYAAGEIGFTSKFLHRLGIGVEVGGARQDTVSRR